jgi:hypothetical protein
MSYLRRISAVVLLMSFGNCPTTAKQRTLIQLNLPEGFTWTVKLATETRCVTDLNPDEQLKYRRDRAVTFLCRVREKRVDGDMRIEFQYRQIRDVDYGFTGYPNPCEINDSTVEDNPQGASYRERALRALCGRTFVAEVTPMGQVRRVEGFPRLYDDLHRALAFRWTGLGNLKIDEKFYRKQMEDGYEGDFQKFFGGYWPLSEDSLKETVQQLFFVWPREGINARGSWRTDEAVPAPALRRNNSWTLKERKIDVAVVELTSQVRMDLSLCEPNIPDAHCDDSGSDFLSAACYCYQKFKDRYNYAGQRKGVFHVDLNTGLIRDATWNEDLSGTVILRDPDRGKPEPVPCPSKRTLSVSIETTNQAVTARVSP